MKKNRRAFLKTACVAACAVGAGIFGIGRLTSMMNQVEALKNIIAEKLIKRHGKREGQALMAAIVQEFQTACASLPYLGSKEENRWVDNMPPTALALATYRALVPQEANLQQVGQILFESVQIELSGLPSLFMRMMYNEKTTMERLRTLAVRSQRRQYAQDWVMTFAESSGEDFTYGLNVTECAIQKYLTKQKAPELTRYLCLTDYLSSKAMNRGLVRFKTLAEGCAVCDFRFKEGRPSYLHPLRDGWPPKFVDSQA